MAVLEILKFPNEFLTQRAEFIEKIDDDIKKLSYDMLATMYAGNGIGLSAPQVGVLKSMIVMDVSKERNSPLVFINPVLRLRGKSAYIPEGCLSFPGLFFKVKRYDTVVVRALSIDKPEPLQFTAHGLSAVCIQHEVDHLKGRTFLDKLPNNQKKRLIKSFEVAKTWNIPGLTISYAASKAKRKKKK